MEQARPSTGSRIAVRGPRERRGDIDGLRAVAVLGVLVYHLGIPGSPGGYSGVDIFFVISGYLIAGILAAELENGTFSLLGFYERRIRRILPAVSVMCLMTTVIGGFLLLPNDLKTFAHSLLSVVTFSSNLYFMSTTGYFGGNADEYPLLHAWSLSIEEQYYLVFPILIAALWRFGVGRARLALTALAIASFAYSVYVVDARPAQAYFSTPARVWELLCGAILAVGPVPALTSRTLRETAAVAGVLLIGTGFVFLNSTTPFPGAAALPPVAGTVLLLHAGASGETRIGSWLSCRPLILAGLASYSIYLWHWPLIVFAKYRWAEAFAPEAPGATLLLASIGVLSLFIGYLSWRFVEQPFLKLGPPPDPRSTIEIALVPTLLAGVLALAIILGQGWWWRWPDAIRAHQDWPLRGPGILTAECQPMDPDSGWPRHVCRIGRGSGDPATLLWGDSHARGLARALVPSIEASGKSLALAISPGCPPLIGVRVYGRSRTKAACDDRNIAVLDQIREQKIKSVILFARWAYYAEGTRYGLEAGEDLPLSKKGVSGNPKAVAKALTRTLAALAGLGVEVLIVGPVPEHTVPISTTMLRRLAWEGPPIPDLALSSFMERQKNVLPVLKRLGTGPKLQILYPHEQLCPAASCRYQENGEPLYVDHDHLSDQGFRAIGPTVQRILSATAHPPVDDSEADGSNRSTNAN